MKTESEQGNRFLKGVERDRAYNAAIRAEIERGADRNAAAVLVAIRNANK